MGRASACPDGSPMYSYCLTGTRERTPRISSLSSLRNTIYNHQQVCARCGVLLHGFPPSSSTFRALLCRFFSCASLSPLFGCPLSLRRKRAATSMLRASDLKRHVGWGVSNGTRSLVLSRDPRVICGCDHRKTTLHIYMCSTIRRDTDTFQKTACGRLLRNLFQGPACCSLRRAHADDIIFCFSDTSCLMGAWRHALDERN